MKRYHQELERIRKNHRFHLWWVHNYPKQPVDCPCDIQAGRFRKRKALGCSKARCLVCNYGKVFKIASIKDRIREQKFTDSLHDYFEPVDEVS